MLQKEGVDLNAVLARASETARPLIDACRHRLAVTQPSRPVMVSADPTRLAQVAGSLLTNAAKYCDGGCRLDLVLEEDSMAVIRVAAFDSLCDAVTALRDEKSAQVQK